MSKFQIMKSSIQHMSIALPQQWNPTRLQFSGSRQFALVLLTLILSYQTSFTQNGNVGIGLTNPESLLHLASTLTGDSTGIRISSGGSQNSYFYNTGTDLIIRNKLNANQLVLDQNGNIGAGTDAPAARLHVKQTGEAIRIDGANAMLNFYQNTTSKGYLGHLFNEMYLMNVVNKELHLGTSDSVRLTIAANGDVGVGTDVPDAKIHLSGPVQGDSTGLKVSAGAQHGLVYLDNDDLVLRKDNKTNQLVLDQSGRIGLGTNAPADDLHVKGSYGWMRVDGQEPAFSFYHDTDWLGYLQTINDNLRIQNKKPGKTFVGNNGLIQMTINADGLVGLGTQFPEARLHLNSSSEDEISGIRLSTLSGSDHSVIYNKNSNMFLGIQGINKHLVLTSNGGVGIGTDIPDALLHVKSGQSSYAGILQCSSNTGTWMGIGNTGNNGKFFNLISSGSNNTGGAGNLLIYSGSDWDQATTLAMAISGYDGRVAIGTTEFGWGYDLSVGGKIISEGLRVQAIANWPDYVFEPAYDLPAPHDVASFIDKHGHLPGFDPAAVVESEGLDMERITIQQQEWLEVSTLYILDQESRIQQLEQQVEQQSRQIDLLLKKLENK
jgi:hypothetical protein